MCGEKATSVGYTIQPHGSPPHVRGKGLVHNRFLQLPGITPACAGKRVTLPADLPEAEDHPRMCGEKGIWLKCLSLFLGSPPHVRGKAVRSLFLCLFCRGSPPRMRGKADRDTTQDRTAVDHPRVCGEKFCFQKQKGLRMGSPPRMRGKDCTCFTNWCVVGITPAYAGKRTSPPFPASRRRDHPRVCGEKNCAVSIDTSIAGSPPRMRGKAQIRLLSIWQKRITPAYAGKSRSWSAHRQQQRRRHRQQPLDHPRVCGEKTKKIP